MKNGKKTTSKNKNIVVTITAIIIVIAATLNAMAHVNLLGEESCWDKLNQSLTETKKDITNRITTDQKTLEVIAAVLSTYEESQFAEMHDLLDLYGGDTLISHLELMLSDGRIFCHGGEFFSDNTAADFEELKVQGAHISGIMKDTEHPEIDVIKNYAPVIRNGETVALVCGVIYLDDMSAKWQPEAFGGEAAVYIIDRSTGEFLLDTWHKELIDIEDIGARNMKRGYTQEDLKDGLLSGETGHAVFTSETIGKPLYFCYEPLDINEWTIALSVPEDIAFARASEVRLTMALFLLFEVAAAVVYIVYMLRKERMIAAEKDRELRLITYTYEISRPLFSAHNDESNIYEALSKVAAMARAETAALKLFGQEDGEIDRIYVWGKDEERAVYIKKLLQSNPYFTCKLVDALTDEIVVHNCAECAHTEGCPLHVADRPGLRNMVEVPISDGSNKITGILSVFNLEYHQRKAEYLETVSVSFGMAFSNMMLFNRITEMGERDVLTGLRNRNKYEQDFAEIAGSSAGTAIGCAYIDANGLHYINNMFGHEAGDEMLRTVARALRTSFDTDYIYRVGGDEFIVLQKGASEEIMQSAAENMQRIVEEAEYNVAVGISVGKDVANAEDLEFVVKQAEAIMYADKQEFYGGKNGRE